MPPTNKLTQNYKCITDLIILVLARELAQIRYIHEWMYYATSKKLTARSQLQKREKNNESNLMEEIIVLWEIYEMKKIKVQYIY